MIKKKVFAASLAALVFSVVASASSRAQELAEAALPEAPAPQSSSVVVNGADKTPVKEDQDKQTKRILYIFPNFRSVSSSDHLPAQTVKDKFVTASEDSFDYSAFVLPALLAEQGYATNSTPEFGTGGVGFGRYMWHTYTDQTIENYMVEFIVPVITREDTRYYTLGHGGFVKRAGYSMSRVVVTRTDRDHRSFNFSEVGGALGAAAISNFYYPKSERNVSNVMSKWALNVGIDAGTFMIREFWPDVNHYLFHGKSTIQAP